MKFRSSLQSAEFWSICRFIHVSANYTENRQAWCWKIALWLHILFTLFSRTAISNGMNISSYFCVAPHTEHALRNLLAQMRSDGRFCGRSLPIWPNYVPSLCACSLLTWAAYIELLWLLIRRRCLDSIAKRRGPLMVASTRNPLEWIIVRNVSTPHSLRSARSSIYSTAIV